MDNRKTGYHWGKNMGKVDGYTEFLVKQIMEKKVTYQEVKITLLFYKQRKKLRIIINYLKQNNPSLLKDVEKAHT